MKPIAELDRTETWIFDLDNTLYPASSGLMAEVSSRMTLFVAETLGVDADTAHAEQKRMFRRHGTTLRGLMTDHAVDPDAFMAFVHGVDYARVRESPRLAGALAALSGRKIVFTNASVAHAQTVLARLGVADAFDGIFDVAAAGYVPKPSPDSYAALIARHRIDPANAVMIEDIAPNLAPAAEMGMTTLWVRHDCGSQPDWAVPGDDAGYVHYETDDIVDWLERVAGRG